MPTTRRRLVIALIVMTTALARPVAAQDCKNVPFVGVDSQADIGSMVAAADALLEKRDRQAARDKLVEANKQKPCVPVALSKLAHVQEDLGDLAAAYDAYAQLAAITLDVPEEKTEIARPIRKLINETKKDVGRLAPEIALVSFAISGPDAKRVGVTVDDKPWDHAHPHALLPGKETKVKIAITSDEFRGGFREERRALTFVAGESRQISVKTEDLEIPLAPWPDADADDALKAARKTFRTGLDEAEDRAGHPPDWKAALAAFDQLPITVTHPHVKFNRAVAAMRLGRRLEAYRGFAMVASAEGAPGLARWVLERARRYIQGINGQVAKITVRSRVTLASMKVDGKPLEKIFANGEEVFIQSTRADVLPSGDVVILVEPGERSIEISTPGHETWEESFVLSAGQSFTVKPNILPEHHVNRTPGWFIIGAGGASLIAGGVAGIVALEDWAKANRLYCRAGHCKPAGFNLIDNGRAAGNVSTALFITAGGLVFLGGLTAVFGWDTRDPARSNAGSVAVTGVRLGTRGIALQGEFW